MNHLTFSKPVSRQKIETVLTALPGAAENGVVHRLHLGARNILILPWSLKIPCLLQQPPTCFEQEDSELSYREMFFVVNILILWGKWFKEF